MFVNAWQFQSTGLDHTFVESDYEKHMEDRRDVFRHQFLTARETGEKRIQEEGQKTQRSVALYIFGGVIFHLSVGKPWSELYDFVAANVHATNLSLGIR